MTSQGCESQTGSLKYCYPNITISTLPKIDPSRWSSSDRPRRITVSRISDKSLVGVALSGLTGWMAQRSEKESSLGAK
jgi:hypothetical protein